MCRPPFKITGMFSILISFLRSPEIGPPLHMHWRQGMNTVAKLLVSYFAWLTAILGGLYMLGLLLEACTGSNSMLELWRSQARQLPGDTAFERAFIAVCYAPFIEELAFRFYLDMQRGHIALSFSILLNMLWSGGPFWLDFQQLVRNGCVVAAGILLVYMIVSGLPGPRKIRPGYVIIFSAMAFGLSHLLNYQALNGHNWPLACLLVLPQVLAGWMLAYMRLCYGFMWAVALHAAMNGCCLLLQAPA